MLGAWTSRVYCTNVAYINVSIAQSTFKHSLKWERKIEVSTECIDHGIPGAQFAINNYYRKFLMLIIVETKLHLKSN